MGDGSRIGTACLRFFEDAAFSYRGVGDVQVNILSRHRGHVISIELNTEPALAGEGQAELEVIGAHWRWR